MHREAFQQMSIGEVRRAPFGKQPFDLPESSPKLAPGMIQVLPVRVSTNEVSAGDFRPIQAVFFFQKSIRLEHMVDLRRLSTHPMTTRTLFEFPVQPVTIVRGSLGTARSSAAQTADQSM